ncbi:MAG: EF-P lysine aminoacylase EpmA [Polyangiaceae bacterium]
MSGLSPEKAPSVYAPSDLAEMPGNPRSIRVGGRVVHVEGASVMLADAFGAVRVEVASPDLPSIGDLVVIQGTPRPGRVVQARVVERVTPQRPPGTFGSVDSAPVETETSRIQGRGVGRSLAARAALFRAIRSFFDARHFLEVDTPSLVPSPGMDLHLDAFESPGAGYLITSPEYQMKRLLVGGIPRCYQLARCFRRGEEGSRHNREFVMVEWYRAFADMDDVIRDTEDLVRFVAQEISGTTTIEAGSVTVDLAAPFERITVARAFERYAGIEEDRALRMATEDEDRFFRLLVDRVEPKIARQARPVFVTGYPASQASLARLSPADPRVCERFELYVGGVELCNGFGELTDPVEQRRRFAHDQEERARQGKPVYPVDERFVGALEEGMPRAAGNALGVDRLLSLCLGERAIGDVMAFPRTWL